MEHQVHVGDIVDVTITGIQPYGAFALLPSPIFSEISGHNWLASFLIKTQKNARSVYSPGVPLAKKD